MTPVQPGIDADRWRQTRRVIAQAMMEMLTAAEAAMQRAA
jgi:hypothetical protein